MDLDDFEEFLADQPRDEKWELIGGRVVKMMVGARWEHHYITRNLDFNLTRDLRAKGMACRVLTESFPLKDKVLRSSILPDVIVRCGPMPPGASSMSDPTVLMEVVSEGSVGRDRFEKWHVYQKLPTLQHYALIERDSARIEIFDRAGDAWGSHGDKCVDSAVVSEEKGWFNRSTYLRGDPWFTQRLLEGLDAVLELSALGLSIPLAEIYRDVLND